MPPNHRYRAAAFAVALLLPGCSESAPEGPRDVGADPAADTDGDPTADTAAAAEADGADAPAPPAADWVIALDLAGVEPLSPALLGQYDLSGALLGYDAVAGLPEAMAAVGFSEWRIGVGRWEAASLLLPTLTDGSPCAFPLPAAFAPAGWTDLDLIASRDWFADTGAPVMLADTTDDARYRLDYVRATIDAALAFGVEPFVSIDLMPRALAVNREPHRADCQWSFMNAVSNAAPADPQVFAAAVAGLARRVVEGSGGEPGRAVRYWEVWNEPELPQFWDPAFDTGLDTFFDAAVQALVQLHLYREASDHPAAAALRFGLASFARYETAVTVLPVFDTAELPIGGRVPLDFVSFHSYDNDPLVTAERIEAVAATLAATEHYQDIDLALAEWGPDLSTGDTPGYYETLEPARLVATVLAIGANAGLDRAHHALFWEYYAPGVPAFGLLRHDLTLKPVGHAYALLAAVVTPGAVRLAPIGTHHGRLGDREGAVLAARAADGTVRALLVNGGSEPRTVAFTAADGASLGWTALRILDAADGPPHDVTPAAGAALTLVPGALGVVTLAVAEP